jgi:hypothetical protein
LNAGERRLELFWQGNTTGAVSARVLVEAHGAWVLIASGSLGEEKRLVLDAPEILETSQDKLSSLKATYVRVELLDAHGVAIAWSIAPVNVDCPQQFCGTVLVGSAMSTLDEQIAFAGCGMPQTYRQQLDFIERQRSRESVGKAFPAVLTHQADLDRFFRNVQTGFRGMRARLRALPNSEFTVRRTLKDLARWCQESVEHDTNRLSTECRMFLIDRLVREMRATLDSCEQNRFLAPKIRAIAREFQVVETLASASHWLHSQHDRRVRPYVADTIQLLAAMSKRLEDVEAK